MPLKSPNRHVRFATLAAHQLRLRRILDALERQMMDPDAPGFLVHDHYVVRLMDLFDVAGAVLRLVARS
jgi:hypothetical protein